jgi:hypothetical protein
MNTVDEVDEEDAAAEEAADKAEKEVKQQATVDEKLSMWRPNRDQEFSRCGDNSTLRWLVETSPIWTR